MSALIESIARARAAWPGVLLAEARFLAYVEERVASGTDALSLHLEDLYIACACASGDERAIAAFRARFGPAIRHAARTAGESSQADEVVQRVFAKLFVAVGGQAPRITRYGGAGKLSTWLQVVSRREAQNLAREQRGATAGRGDDEDLLILAAAGDDPLFAGMKVQYAAAFRLAFADALGDLTARERNLLRYECVDELTRDQIARLYGVSTITVARWRAACRTRLFELTRDHFRARVGLGPSEFRSVLRVIESQMDVSLPRLLRDNAIVDASSERRDDTRAGAGRPHRDARLRSVRGAASEGADEGGDERDASGRTEDDT